jgi:hypothetical protein
MKTTNFSKHKFRPDEQDADIPGKVLIKRVIAYEDAPGFVLRG